MDHNVITSDIKKIFIIEKDNQNLLNPDFASSDLAYPRDCFNLTLETVTLDHKEHKSILDCANEFSFDINTKMIILRKNEEMPIQIPVNKEIKMVITENIENSQKEVLWNSANSKKDFKNIFSKICIGKISEIKIFRGNMPVDFVNKQSDFYSFVIEIGYVIEMNNSCYKIQSVILKESPNNLYNPNSNIGKELIVSRLLIEILCIKWNSNS